MRVRLLPVTTGPIYTTHAVTSGSSLMTSQLVMHHGKNLRRRVSEDTTMQVPIVLCMLIKQGYSQKMVSFPEFKILGFTALVLYGCKKKEKNPELFF